MPYMGKAEETKEVQPIVLTSENQKDRLKEITDRLEQGILYYYPIKTTIYLIFCWYEINILVFCG